MWNLIWVYSIATDQVVFYKSTYSKMDLSTFQVKHGKELRCPEYLM